VTAHPRNELGARLALGLLGGRPLARSTGSNLGGHLLGCVMRLTPRGARSVHLGAALPTSP
jgi:hypothetical protein